LLSGATAQYSAKNILPGVASFPAGGGKLARWGATLVKRVAPISKSDAALFAGDVPVSKSGGPLFISRTSLPISRTALFIFRVPISVSRTPLFKSDAPLCANNPCFPHKSAVLTPSRRHPTHLRHENRLSARTGRPGYVNPFPPNPETTTKRKK
jgi:hypothetical protein